MTIINVEGKSQIKMQHLIFLSNVNLFNNFNIENGVFKFGDQIMCYRMKLNLVLMYDNWKNSADNTTNTIKTI